MMAEVENELDNPGVAIGYMNEVREKASTNMPLYRTQAMEAIYPVSTKAEIFDAIVHERMVELSGEQVRYNDLIRWYIAVDVLSQFGFVKGKDGLFPILQNEIDANEVLTNADQNPAY